MRSYIEFDMTQTCQTVTHNDMKTSDAWNLLEYASTWRIAADQNGPALTTEIRICSTCGKLIGKEISEP